MARYTVRDTIDLYEGNYDRLARLIPDLSQARHSLVLEIDENLALSVGIVEQSRYTTVIDLAGQFAIRGPWVEDPFMRIRMCHDARVAEVVASQVFCSFAARYPKRNKFMFGEFEKRQVNRFLGEWLDHCLARRNAFIIMAPGVTT